MKVLTRAAVPKRAQVVQKPLIPTDDMVEETSRYVMSDHAIERAYERGIGIMEIYSAIADPDMAIPSRDSNAVTYTRGDIRVVTDPTNNNIITVADINSDYRKSPREPLNPLVPKGKPVARATKAAPKANSATLDEAWCLVPHDLPETRELQITPDLAKRLLQLNDANRPVSKPLVAQYADQMAAGAWVLTHQGIALSTIPKLQDGQHRLLAVITSGVTIPCYVSVGMPVQNFAKLDTGRNRKFGDVLAIAGYTDTFRLGAAARLIYAHLHQEFTDRPSKVHNDQVLEVVNADPDGLKYAMSIGRQLNKEFSLNFGAGTAVYYLVQRVNHAEDVERYYDGLISGADLKRTGRGGGGDPRLVLRRVIMNFAKLKGRGDAIEQMALSIKAWNLFAEMREDVTTLSWRKDEAMPRITRIGRN